MTHCGFLALVSGKPASHCCFMRCTVSGKLLLIAASWNLLFLDICFFRLLVWWLWLLGTHFWKASFLLYIGHGFLESCFSSQLLGTCCFWNVSFWSRWLSRNKCQEATVSCRTNNLGSPRTVIENMGINGWHVFRWNKLLHTKHTCATLFT